MTTDANKVAELYENTKRKEALIEMLETQLKEIKDASDMLEKKAWDILTLTSGTFGIVTALQVSFTNIAKFYAFPVIVMGVLSLYAALLYEVVQVVRARTWPSVPGIASPQGEPFLQRLTRFTDRLDRRAKTESFESQLSYETLLSKYLPVSDDIYLNKLIVDYVGKLKNGAYLPGATQVALINNRTKSGHLQIATILAGVIIALVIFVSSFAAAL